MQGVSSKRRSSRSSGSVANFDYGLMESRAQVRRSPEFEFVRQFVVGLESYGSPGEANTSLQKVSQCRESHGLGTHRYGEFVVSVDTSWLPLAEDTAVHPFNLND
jgi:hypothetical protein